MLAAVLAARTSFAGRSVLTERAVNSKGSKYDWLRPYFHFAKGLAHYRQGRFEDAISIMTGDASKAAEYMGPSPRLVAAMALYQEGQKDEARKLLAAAVLSYDWSAEKAHHVRSRNRSHPSPRGRGDPSGSVGISGWRNTNKRIDAEFAALRERPSRPLSSAPDGPDRRAALLGQQND